MVAHRRAVAQPGRLRPRFASSQLRWRSGTRPWPWLSIDFEWPDPRPLPKIIPTSSLGGKPLVKLRKRARIAHTSTRLERVG